MKKLLWVVLAVVLILVIAVGALILWIDPVVRRTVESQSQKQLDVPVTLSGADVGLLGGTLQLEKYVIGSPQGFSAPAMFSVDDVSVAVSYGQLRQDPIRIQRIEIEKPLLVLEHGGGGRFNLQALMEKIQQAPEPQQQPEPEEEPLRLIIDRLRINGATVALRPGDLSGVPLLGNIDLEKLDIKEEYRLTLPAIDITNIGTAEGAENGAAIREVVMQVMSAMAAKAAESPELPEPVRMLLSGNLDAIGDMMQAEFKAQIGKVAEDLTKKLPGEAGKALDQTLKEVTTPGGDPGKAIEKGLQEGLGGILGERKKEEQRKEEQRQENQR